MARNGTIYLNTLKSRKRFGDLVKARRIDLGLTQVTASSLAGVTLTTWNLIENGRRDAINYLTLAKVARALGFEVVDVEEFINGGEAPEGMTPKNPYEGDIREILNDALKRIDRIEEFIDLLRRV